MKLQKLLLIVLSIIITLGLSACPAKPADGPSSDNEYYLKSLELSTKIYEDFYLSNAKRFMAYSPEYISNDIDSDMSGTASLWAYGAVMTMAATQLKFDPDYGALKDKAVMLVENLEEYRMPRKARVYSATVGISEPYYDDNAWVALGMFDIAEALDNDEYYLIAGEITDYVLSGESEDGGVFWKETVSSRNTCSCGPAIIAAIKQYQRTGEERYLQAAERIYQWTKDVLRDPVDYVYWDNAKLENGKENISTAKFTYNSGTMIWAGVLLYQVTGEQSYLQDAALTADGSLEYYVNTTAGGRKYFPPTPWFNLYLLQGYIAYGLETGITEHVETFRGNLDLAWEKGRDKKGYVMPNWGAGAVLDSYKYVSLLQEAATAECYALIANFQRQQED